MLNNNPLNEIAEQLIKTAIACPICAKNRKIKRSMTVLPIERDEEKSIFYAKCGTCNSATISVINASDISGSAMIFLTDLSPSEIKSLKSKKPISIKEMNSLKFKDIV